MPNNISESDVNQYLAKETVHHGQSKNQACWSNSKPTAYFDNINETHQLISVMLSTTSKEPIKQDIYSQTDKFNVRKLHYMGCRWEVII